MRTGTAIAAPRNMTLTEEMMSSEAHSRPTDRAAHHASDWLFTCRRQVIFSLPSLLCLATGSTPVP